MIFSFFYWNYSQNNPEATQHVRLEEWSKPVKIAGRVPNISYDTLFAENEFNLFAISEDNDQRTINQKTFDYSGQLQDETEIARAGYAGFPKVISYSGEDYLFYFAGPGSSDQSLMMKNLNSDDSPVKLRDEISYPNSLSVAEADGRLVLAYIERDQESDQNAISILGYDDLNSEHIFDNTHIFEEEVRYPQMASIDDKIILNWHERNPETTFISSQEDKFNRYLLKIGQLDLETGELEARAELGEAFGNNQANIDAFKSNDQLWISWAVYDRDTERNLIEVGYLDSDEDYQEFTRISGFNPALFVNDNEKIIINSQNLEMRGQAGLYINRFVEEETELKNRRIFPSLNFSSAPEIINHGDGRHLFWAEAASTGSDIYYSNTVEAESIDLMEFMGFNIIDSPLEIISSLGLYFSYPVFAVNIGLINFLIPIIAVGLILYLLSKKFSRINNLNHETPYLSFIFMLVGVLAYNIFYQDSLVYIFSMSEPPAQQIPIIIAGVTIVTIGFIYFLKHEEDHSLYVGIGSVFLWFYWLTQAGLIYELHRFFI